MKVIIGIDGGGTKTRFAAYDLEEERMLGSCILGGTDYKQDGYDLVVERVKKGVHMLLGDYKASELAAISFGMPGYSEDPDGDREMEARLRLAFGVIPVFLFNDVYVAFEGAFYGRAGILVVAGTGSLAYGRNEEGTVDRCGGWSAFFGDEGSGHWIGKQLLETFSKQSDGRLQKSQLYQLTRDYLGLRPDESDFGILSKPECNSGNRAATASLNLIVKQAADQGDAQALAIMNRAVGEIVDLICALLNKLHFQERPTVAVSGGLFHMDPYITKPMEDILKRKYVMAVIKPYLGPCCGAVTLGAEKLYGHETALSLYKAMSDDEKCKRL